jgi:hypothetical protein
VSSAPTPAESGKEPLPSIPIALPPPELVTPARADSEAVAIPIEIEAPTPANPSAPVSRSSSIEAPVPGQSGRPITADYNRRSIPVAPGDDLSIHVDIADPESVHPPPITTGPDKASPSTSGEHGLAGTRRWRERFESLRACLDELVEIQAPPAEIDHAMAFAARALEDLEDAANAARREQRALEGVSEKARDFRATIGRTLDELAAQLSHEKGELDRLTAQRVLLDERRAQLRTQGRETEADGVLWELAAVDQAVGEKAAVHEVLASQVNELQQQLDRENEQLEQEIGVLSQSLDREMARLWPMAGALRAPLDRVEQYVRSTWQATGR